jgi:tRNA threonylcarbamoyladenosine biosynthesis protein TsaB
LSGTPGKADVLLAMETSGDVCSVAVMREGRLFAEHIFRHGMHLSEHLTGHIDAVLREAECQLAEISAFAVGIGPGSFTGTRIGVMTVKTLATVLGVPIYGVEGLLAMAAEYAGAGEVIVPMLPCRTDIVYTGMYGVVEGKVNVIAAPAAVAVSELTDTLAAENGRGALFCGEAIERYRPVLTANLVGRRAISFGRVRCPRAAIIGEIAWQRHQTGDVGEDPLTVLPLYISPPPITMPKTGIRLTDVEISR